MANRNWASNKIFTMHVSPVLLDCNFIVDDTNGLGITSLKGPAIQNVFMHTATTPSNGNTNPATPNKVVTNPNPAAGTIIIQLQDSFNRLFTIGKAIVSPTSGSAVKIDNSAMTAGVAYVISTLGNATAAKWHAIGVPAGITPAVGVSFIAATNGGAGNTLTSRVMATQASTIAVIEAVGDTDLSIAPTPSAAQGFGSQIILQCRDIAGALVAPVAGTKISISLMLSNSSVTVQGE
jgi:hypothetical protein